jgi:multiple sugar transport system ATP-binding protein
VGTPFDVYEHPATPFVAGFTGSPPMNLIPFQGRTLGIRPERLEPSPCADALPLDVTITAAEYIGHEWLIHATGHGATIIRRAPEQGPDVVGQQTTWHAPHARITWF